MATILSAATILHSGSYAVTSGITIATGTGNALYAFVGTTVTLANDGTIQGGDFGTGVVLEGLASVTNSGSIGGPNGVRLGSAGSSLDNTGTIAATAGIGAYLELSGTVTNNSASASITGSVNGLVLAGGLASVANAGTILGASGAGVLLNGGGRFDNAGYDAGRAAGVDVRIGSGTITNTGVIAATGTSNTAAGIYLAAGGTVANTAGATISGRIGMRALSGVTTVTNSGTISGSYSIGVAVVTGGTVTNTASGLIRSPRATVQLQGTGVSLNNAGTIQATGTNGFAARLVDSGTIFNSGTIIGTSVLGSGAIGFSAGNSRLALAPGSTIIGNVTATAAGVMLELAPGTITGSLPSPGNYQGFAGMTIDPGASWVLGSGAGGQTIATTAGLTNSGTLLPSGSVSVSGTLSGGGVILVGAGNALLAAGVTGQTMAIDNGTIAMSASLVAGDIVFMNGSATTPSSGALVLTGAATTSSLPIVGLGVGEMIGLGAFATPITSGDFSGTTLTLANLSTSFTLSNITLAPGVNVNGGGYHFTFGTVATSAGTFQSVGIACFVTGTRIATERGQVPVEALRPGDLVATASGSGEYRPIRWIGRRRVDTRSQPDGRLRPIRIEADAFGPGRPHRDLYLSPDHAIHLPDCGGSTSPGCLIPVRYLANGRTVAQVPAGVLTYWHVELDRHDILIANGLPTESYLDTGNRSDFENAGPVVAMTPEFARDIWDRCSCAPLALEGEAVTAARRYLLARAANLGHVLTLDPEPRLEVGSQTIPPTRSSRGMKFRIDLAGALTVRLASRRAVPAETVATQIDHRVLGVAVSALWFNGRPIPLTSAALGTGWHPTEGGWRWTDGAGVLQVHGPGVLECRLLENSGLPYWVVPTARSATAA